MPTQRNEVLDGLKFLLIILVAVGHFSEPYRYTHTIVLSGYSVIYLFHMPLFILLIGYMIALLCSKPRKTQKPKCEEHEGKECIRTTLRI